MPGYLQHIALYAMGGAAVVRAARQGAEVHKLLRTDKQFHEFTGRRRRAVPLRADDSADSQPCRHRMTGAGELVVARSGINITAFRADLGVLTVCVDTDSSSAISGAVRLVGR